jgi:hypothetical protein
VTERLMTELGVKRATAEALMQKIPIVQIEGRRKVYVRRDDVRRYLDERTCRSGSAISG